MPVRLRLESLLAVTGRRATLRTASVVTSHGLSAAGWWLLDELSSDANGSVLVELARGGGFAPSTITAVSDALSERGLVRRQRDSTDRRLVRLWIASQGLHLVSRIRATSMSRYEGCTRCTTGPIGVYWLPCCPVSPRSARPTDTDTAPAWLRALANESSGSSSLSDVMFAQQLFTRH